MARHRRYHLRKNERLKRQRWHGDGFHRARRRGRKLSQETEDSSQNGPFFDRALALGKDEVNKLSVLQPPNEKAAVYRTSIAGLNQALSLLTRADAAARAGNVGGLQAIIREGNALTQTNLAHARAVGLLVCAKES